MKLKELVNTIGCPTEVVVSELTDKSYVPLQGKIYDENYSLVEHLLNREILEIELLNDYVSNKYVSWLEIVVTNEKDNKLYESED